MGAVDQALEGGLGVTQGVKLDKGKAPKINRLMRKSKQVFEPVISSACHLPGKPNSRKLSKGFENGSHLLLRRLISQFDVIPTPHVRYGHLEWDVSDK